MKVEVKRGRVWLPNNKEWLNKFIEFNISNNKKKESFVTCINKDGRFYIPKQIRSKLNINKEININNIKILNNIKRNEKLIKKNKLNLIAAIPEKTLSNYNIIVVDKKDKYLCWYSAKGRPNEIILNKHLPIEFIKLLGYFQAEGGKPKLQKRRGREFNFTNSDFNLIKEFFELSNYLFDKDLWKFIISHNKNLNKSELDILINKLRSLEIKKSNIKLREDNNLKTYGIRLYVSNSILAETINNMNKLIKELMSKSKNNLFFKYYFRSYIAGDGNFFSNRDKFGSLHSRMRVYEEKEEYINMHKRLFDKYIINGKIRKDPKKNLYYYTITANWFTLLKFLEYNLFINNNHYKKLIWAISNHKKYKAVKHIVRLKNNFSSYDINKLFNKNYSGGSHWLRDREKEGLIFLKYKENNRSYWKLTKEGSKLKRLLKNINSSSYLK